MTELLLATPFKKSQKPPPNFYHCPCSLLVYPKPTMHTNKQEEHEQDECSICNENLPKLSSQFIRMTCCGKGLHVKCHDDIYASSTSDKQKGQCLVCRTKKTCEGSKESTERIQRWVEKGRAWAQCSLGCNYRDGLSVKQSYQQARELFELAARQGDGNAQFNLGQMYTHSLGVDQSYERAAEYNEAAARQGHAGAQLNLGIFYAGGHGVEQSFEAAREWWMKAAEQGHENAIKVLQELDKKEGRTTPSFTPPKRCSTCNTPKTSTHKLKHCKCKGAQYCNATCQAAHWQTHQKEHRRLCKEMNLKNTEGEMKDEVVELEVEEEGETKETTTPNLPQQEEEEDVCPVCIEPLQKDSVKFVRMACCGKGIHKWCYKGIQVSSLSQAQKDRCPLCRADYPKSDEEEIEQVLPWVEKGKAWAQAVLGQRYRDGLGVEQSNQRMKELYTLAAGQGDVDAQYSLGCMYANGQGVDQSYKRAVEYCEAAARQGHADAQGNLGALYCNGQGVEQSFETAREWWMKSAEQGNENAIGALQELDKIEGRTTPSFIPKPFECATCYRPHDRSEHKLKPCKRCHRVYYCGRECQVKHWNKEGKRGRGHKEKCNKKQNKNK